MKLVYIAVGLTLLTACAGNSEVTGERVTVAPSGAVEVCGEGNGLPECKDYNNLTYSENEEYNAPTDKQMEEEAAKVRTESPAQLERTISELEQTPGPAATVAD